MNRVIFCIMMKATGTCQDVPPFFACVEYYHLRCRRHSNTRHQVCFVVFCNNVFCAVRSVLGSTLSGRGPSASPPYPKPKPKAFIHSFIRSSVLISDWPAVSIAKKVLHSIIQIFFPVVPVPGTIQGMIYNVSGSV